MSVKESKLEEIMSESGQNEQKVQKILNILLEAPYFYRDDDLSLFLFLSKYKRALQAGVVQREGDGSEPRHVQLHETRRVRGVSSAAGVL